MIAVHITNKAGYDAIVKAREIRPRGRKRRHGESGWGFETDFLAGDAKYVFLSLGEKYQYETMNETRYFFAFDAHRLISEYDALVGPDLANDYEQIVDAILKETNALPEQFNRPCFLFGIESLRHSAIDVKQRSITSKDSTSMARKEADEKSLRAVGAL